jgi:hypothetical protein
MMRIMIMMILVINMLKTLENNIFLIIIMLNSIIDTYINLDEPNKSKVTKLIINVINPIKIYLIIVIILLLIMCISNYYVYKSIHNLKSLNINNLTPIT